MSVDVRVVDDPAHAAAELLAGAAVAGAHVAVCGGSSVGQAYETATRLQPRWRDVHVWFGDERVVPPTDDRSNYRLVRDTLLDALAAPPEVHRIRGELEPEAAAAQYDEALQSATLDFALNGIGSDGHTASLFPNAPALDELERRAVAAEAGLDPFVPRVTMTVPMFAATGVLVYLVAGESKADAVRGAFAAEPTRETPASLVRGRTTIALVDAAAASLLR